MVLLQSMKNFSTEEERIFFFGKVRWYIRENEYDMLEKYLFILYVGMLYCASIIMIQNSLESCRYVLLSTKHIQVLVYYRLLSM